jgi:hypothetical protein
MAQAIYDMSAGVVGNAPPGWSAPFASDTALVIRESGGARYLELTTEDGANRRVLSWDAGLNSRVMEVYCEVEVISTAADTDKMLAYRIDSSLSGRGDTTCYVTGDERNSTDSARFARYVNGSFSQLATTTSTVAPPVTNIKLRSSVDTDNLHKLKMWESSDSEPATFVFSMTDTGLDQAGYGGLYCQSANSEIKILFFSVGTDGDAAPSAPVATGPDTPINLSVTDLLATSARLNWEQG